MVHPTHYYCCSLKLGLIIIKEKFSHLTMLFYAVTGFWGFGFFMNVFDFFCFFGFFGCFLKVTMVTTTSY